MQFTARVEISGGGADQFNHTDTQNAPTTTLNDLLQGSDQWQQGDSGNFTQNANGTYTAFDQNSATSMGQDMYADANTGNTTTVSPGTGSATPSTGSTTLVDNSTANDNGWDSYSTLAIGNGTAAVNGDITLVQRPHYRQRHGEAVKKIEPGGQYVRKPVLGFSHILQVQANATLFVLWDCGTQQDIGGRPN